MDAALIDEVTSAPALRRAEELLVSAMAKPKMFREQLDLAIWDLDRDPDETRELVAAQAIYGRVLLAMVINGLTRHLAECENIRLTAEEVAQHELHAVVVAMTLSNASGGTSNPPSCRRRPRTAKRRPASTNAAAKSSARRGMRHDPPVF